MLKCPACGRMGEFGDSVCVACGSRLLPRVNDIKVKRGRVWKPKGARRTLEFGRLWARWSRTLKVGRLKSRLWPKLVVVGAVVLLLGLLGLTGTRHSAANARLAKDDVIVLIKADEVFRKDREIWVPAEEDISPNQDWLSNSHRLRGVDSALAPLERKETETGPFRQQYRPEEYEVECPPISLLSALGLALEDDEKVERYYIYHEPKVIDVKLPALGRPGGILHKTVQTDLMYRMWEHRVRAKLTGEGVAESAGWIGQPNRRMFDMKWFPYDCRNPFASVSHSGDANVMRGFFGGWLVPIGRREIGDLTELTMMDRSTAVFQFSWRWAATRVGTAFIAETGTGRGLSPVLQRFVSSPGCKMSSSPNGQGRGHIIFRGGRWSLEGLELTDPQ